MKITVFGATGQTGQHVLQAALDKGYEVTALVRNPDKVDAALRIQHAKQLKLVQGDILDGEAVSKALTGSEGFIFAVGPVKGSPPDLPERAAQTVLAAAKQVGVSRFVWLLGAGVVDSRDEPDKIRKVMQALMRVFAKSLLESSQKAYDQIIQSGMDYTVVRPPVLSNKATQGSLTASYKPPKPSAISRADLGEFMVNALTEEQWRAESPMVAYA
ncbi:MAG: SDR family oxidoreductase [Natronospirillum sp.]|uniref:NAD(P)-dependent oxidoreductase n=1 Tax=Natronospirillum sp. TaxID=2812955 RepID=UPI0025D0E4E5|nr:NAD(P)-binding oxidoreductase [Natronospirillum sp.]MCH8552272.1 SDR family oxidoreductase [Natronospirillum sp.]